MPFEDLLFTLRRKFSQRLLAVFDGRAQPTAAAPIPISQPYPLEPEYVQEVRHLVEDHLAEAYFSVDALCRASHASQPQLYRKLTALSGLSPVRFIRSVRMRKAKELLRQTDLTVAEIAYETGFTSPCYFSRLFVKTFGMTPSEYRKKGDTGADE